MSSKKRSLDSTAESPPTKVQKVHPFFAKPAPGSDADSGPLRWLKPLGVAKSCLHAVHLEPKPSTKVAAFDIDGTIIASSFSMVEWKWWNACVPKKLAAAAQAGYAVVLVTNQAGLKTPKMQEDWKKKIGSVVKAMGDVPFRLYAATKKDNYRKPLIGMWEELEKQFADDGVQIDKSASFFVGDAAGRVFPESKVKKDFAGTDRKWALNVGVAFHTPEEYFLDQAPDPNVHLFGFHVSSLPTDLPLFAPNNTPLVPKDPTQELVIFVGYPCLGKSTFFAKHFEPKGYKRVNQDTLKTRDRCIKAVREALEAGDKCVVDNTNRDVSTRRFYLDVARKLGIPVRCMVFTGSLELAWHNNIYRGLCLPASVAEREPAREFLGMVAFTSFKADYEEPQPSEGFTEVKKINWVFEGTEEDKKAWSMWTTLDEKKNDK
ncbi:hypothetical protein MKEN_01262700 [Mycena kentingensis (nom. inval.)]|nr:hypothetical protein MKEN_01262700 [Mycena kentingensis (nom. inval.)]